MRWLALLLVMAAAADAQPRFQRFTQRTPQGRNTRGLLSDSYAFFEFAPADGAGMPAACSTTAPTGAKGEAYTYVRPGVVWCTADDFSLVQLSANVAPVMRGRSGASLGVLIEPVGQNDFLNNRDLSQATTTKTSMTCAKTATGVDGVANSATTCTASGASSTALQAIVRASAANATSMYIRRRTGTGTVSVTRDNGTTWSDITSSLTSSWKRAVCRDTEGCMGGRCIIVADLCATSANPTVGIRISTSGDAVDVDLVQNETGPQNTSPITTLGAAAPRQTPTSSYFDLPATLPVARSFSASTVAGRALQGGYMAQAYGGVSTDFMAPYALSVASDSLQDIGCAYYHGGATSQGTNTGSPQGGVWNLTCDSSSTTKSTCTNGQCTPPTATAIGDITNVTRVYIGTTAVGTATNWLGVISEVCLDGAARCAAPKQIRPSGTHIVWLGDSITFGGVSAPTRPPHELRTNYAAASSRMVQNAGWPGDTVAQMKTRWDSYIAQSGFGTLVFLGGINDLRIGTSAATTYATAVQILNDARSRGMTVVVLGVTPWKNWVEWTAGRQTETDSYNALLSAWAGANGATYVSTDSLGTGSPLALAPAYDSGDGLHPNAAGSTALAALVAGAAP